MIAASLLLLSSPAARAQQKPPAAKAAEPEWLTDAEGRQYRLEQIPKSQATKVSDTKVRTIFGVPIRKYEPGWIVGEGTHVAIVRGDSATQPVWFILLESGRLVASPQNESRLSVWSSATADWQPTAQGMTAARRWRLTS